MASKTDPLFVELVRRVGLLKAYKVLLFIISWGIVWESTGGPVGSIEDYAKWWKANERGAYREQMLFRAAFEDDATPNRIWEQRRAQNEHHEKFVVLVKQLEAATDRMSLRRLVKVQEAAARLGTLSPSL